jgi:endonuclease/exonuclease/phosphatase (EEP) superfamily protein YafD
MTGMTADARPRPARRRLAALALAATILVSLPLVAGFLGRLHPALDAFSHFRAHLAVIMALCALALMAARQWLHGAAGLLLAFGAFATTTGLLPPESGAAAARPGSDAAARYALLHLNLRHDNGAPEKVLSLIGRTRPDVITLAEAAPRWRERLAAISAAYPHAFHCDGRGTSVMILSRRPLIGEGECPLGGRAALATVDFGGRSVAVAGLHLSWPWPFGQTQEIGALLPRLAALGERSLAAGDFNAADWSAAVRLVADGGGFERPPRLGSTWIARRLPDALRRTVGLPIDHVMAKRGVVLHEVRRLDDVGSDHLPVLAEFSLRPEPEPGMIAVARRSGPLAPPPG